MQRYAVSSIVGDGLTDETRFRPKIADYDGINWGVAISPDQQTNPNKRWVLALVSGTATALATMNGDADITVLALGPEHLALPWTQAATQQARQQYASAITSRTGVPISRDDTRTVREILIALGQSLDSTFDLKNLGSAGSDTDPLGVANPGEEPTP